MVAVELDESLSARLSGEFGDDPKVEVVTADARQVDIGSLVEANAPYKVVANLPYYAASPIVRRFLTAEHKPRLMVVMVQREVARGMTAAPGKMGLLSVAIQVYGLARVVTLVPPRAFRPPPKVTSAVIRVDVYDEPAVAFDSEESFFHLVRAGFSAPRKQIRNNLRHGLKASADSVQTLLSHADIDPTRRAETLSLTEWASLYHAYQEAIPAGSQNADD